MAADEQRQRAHPGGGAGAGQQGYASDTETKTIYLNKPSPTFASDLEKMLKQGVVNVSYPGNPTVLSKVDAYVRIPNGMDYVTLESAIPASGRSGKVYAFTRTATDYA